jgi:hypothetical protein
VRDEVAGVLCCNVEILYVILLVLYQLQMLHGIEMIMQVRIEVLVLVLMAQFRHFVIVSTKPRKLLCAVQAKPPLREYVCANLCNGAISAAEYKVHHQQ